MDSARWERVQALFHEAADLPAGDQRAFLEEACGGDASLLENVVDLLGEEARGDSLLDRDVAHLAHHVLETPAELPFHEFGPYRLIRRIGEGGMGLVYLAERDDLHSLVAIKILRDAWLSPARRDRFTAEQRTLAQLNHPSIARLYDADTLPDGTPWFAMEYVEGVPLTAYCERRGSSIRQRLELFRAVCEAVQYAHRYAVIHRDLKPSNVLAKDDGTVRLLDFGIAKQLDRLELAADQTRTELRLMTPSHAAPEQIRGEKVGIYTDVYALGVMLYELLSGRLPFDLSALTPGQAELVIAEQSPEKPSAIARRANRPLAARESAWADLDVLCLTAMHKDVQRRYRSVEALIRDVDHYLKGEPLEARPDNLRYRLGKFVRRNARSVAAGAVMVIILVGLVAFFTFRLAVARNVALAEAARTQRVQQFMLNLFEGGDKATGPSDDLRVVTLLERGVQEARTLDADPAIQSELYQTLGGIYQKLGNLERADSLLRTALDRRKSIFGAEHPEVAESIVGLGLLRADQARLEEAERLVREGLALASRELPPDHPQIAKAATALGQVLEQRGFYDKAIQVLEESARLREKSSPETLDLASTLGELANCHFYAGHYSASESLNQRVLSIHQRIFGNRHPLVADDIINLGAIQFELGHYKEAEARYRQALAIIQPAYGKDHHRTASNLSMLARALIAQDRNDEATGLLRQALAIQERVYGKMHPRVASALNELGNAAVRRKHLDEAEAHFRRTADIYRAVYGEGHYQLGIALSNLATVYLERGENVRAERVYRDVVRRFTAALSPEHMNTGIAHIKLGRSLVRQRRFAEAEEESRRGYEILTKQANPAVRWLHSARSDLALAYEGLHQPEKAKRFRAELAQYDAKGLPGK